jgi:hypothetical protein
MGAEIRFQGFEVGILGRAITWEEYLAHLATKNGSLFKYKSFDRIICLDVTSNASYIYGLFVTIKDLKRFCEYREADGQFALSARELEDGSRMAEFNFFIIHKKTHRGIYQFYYSSCSLQRFLGLLTTEFFALRKYYISELTSNSTGEIKREIAALRSTELKTEILVRHETFDALLKDFDYIKEMKVNVTTYDADSSKYVAFKDHIKKRTEHFIFKKGGIVSDLRSKISNLAHQPEIDDLKVRGVSLENNAEYTIGIFKNITDFGRYKYNDLTEHFDINPNTFMKSQVIELLLGAAKEHNYILG